jgi:hypothetical protein
MVVFLGVPLWAWITGGALVGTGVVVDQAGDAAEQVGGAAEKGAHLAKWAVAGGALYVSYRALKSSGALK